MAKKNEKTEKIPTGNEAWETVYNGHTIRVVYRHKSRLYIDGNEVAKEGGLGGHLRPILTAQIPDTDETVIAMLDASSSETGLTCRLVIGKAVDIDHGIELKSGEFHAFTNEEEQQRAEDEEASVMAAVMTNIFLN